MDPYLTLPTLKFFQDGKHEAELQKTSSVIWEGSQENTLLFSG